MNRRANILRLDRANRRLAGVCAGVAHYLEVPAFLVRLIYVLACLAWPTLIIAYQITWWWLKNREEQGSDFLADSKWAGHFRRIDYRKQLYRNPARARIAGVCSGIADYLEIRTFTVRILTLLSFFIFGPLTFFAYLVFWISLEKNPDEVYSRRCGRRSERHQRRQARRERRRAAFNRTMGYAEPAYAADDVENHETHPDWEEREEDSNEAIAMSLKECSAAFNTVESRLRDVEAFITSKRFRLHCEINRI